MAMSLKKSIPLVVMVMAVPAIPAVIFTLVGWGEASNIWMLGTVTGALAILSSTFRLSVYTVILLAIASVLAVLNQGNPWGSMLIMGACAAISGIASIRGLISAVNFFAISAAFFVAQPPVVSTSLSTVQDALVVGFIALCSAALGKPIQAQLAVMGDMTLGGTIAQARNLAESLQVAFDAGAKRILLPMSSVTDIPSVPGELFAKFQTSFYSDPVDAVFKALGVE